MRPVSLSSIAAGSVTLALGFAVLVGPLQAQQPKTLTVEELMGMLQNRAPEPTTLTVDELERLQQNRLVVREAEDKAARGESFTVVERRRLADISQEPGYASVDLEIYFDYDSNVVRPEAKRQLVSLGQALTDDQLAGSTFVIAGHTDAKGGAEYNQDLSERRAQTVRQFLIATFDLRSHKLIALGFGKEELKNLIDPYASENRRVQIVNVSR
jgi:outer membrane protein OmpA-like peptidoglycan-associated protein